MKLNIQLQIDIQSSINLTDDEVEFLNKHRKNVENTIKNMVYDAFGDSYCDEAGFQKISLKILQNELTSVGEPVIIKPSNDKGAKINEVEKHKTKSKKKKTLKNGGTKTK